MGRVTVDMTLDEVLSLPSLAPYAPYMVYAPAHVPREELPTWGLGEQPLSELGRLGWSGEAIASGMDSFLSAIDEGRASCHDVYGREARGCERDVSLIHITPERPDPKRPFVVLCSGGAYKNVCNIAEGITCAPHFERAGHHVFLLTYRVSVPKVAPIALCDVATSLEWISRHASELSVDPGAYAICGFSAGGNLASTWGLPSVGYRAHGIAKPLCVCAVYACTDLVLESERNESHGMLPRMFGDDWHRHIDAYDVVRNVDGDYPACFVVCGRDDGLLSPAHSERLHAALVAAHVRCVFEEHGHAPHGFGDGTGTEAVGWPLRAIAFMDTLSA